MYLSRIDESRRNELNDMLFLSARLAFIHFAH